MSDEHYFGQPRDDIPRPRHVTGPFFESSVGVFGPPMGYFLKDNPRPDPEIVERYRQLKKEGRSHGN